MHLCVCRCLSKHFHSPCQNNEQIVFSGVLSVLLVNFSDFFFKGMQFKTMGCRFFHIWYLLMVHIFLVILCKSIWSVWFEGWKIIFLFFFFRKRTNAFLTTVKMANVWKEIGPGNRSRWGKYLDFPEKLDVIWVKLLCNLCIAHCVEIILGIESQVAHEWCPCVSQFCLAECYQSYIMPSNQHRQLYMFCLVKEMPWLPSALKLSLKSIRCGVVRLDNLISPLFSRELLLEVFLLCRVTVELRIPVRPLEFSLVALNALR